MMHTCIHVKMKTKKKKKKLLWHMLIAVVSVSVLIAITRGLRESLIVFIAIPGAGLDAGGLLFD